MKFSAVIVIAIIAVVASLAMVDATLVLDRRAPPTQSQQEIIAKERERITLKRKRPLTESDRKRLVKLQEEALREEQERIALLQLKYLTREKRERLDKLQARFFERVAYRLTEHLKQDTK